MWQWFILFDFIHFRLILHHYQIFFPKDCLVIKKGGESGLSEPLATIRQTKGYGANTRPETEL